MENKPVIKKSADARVVQAVRRLKSTRQKDNTIEVRKNQDDTKHPTIILNKPEYINDISSNNLPNLDKKPKNSLNLPNINRLNKKPSIINDNSIILNNNPNINKHSSVILNNNNSNSNILVPQSGVNRKEISKSHSKIKISIDGSLQKPGTSSTNKTTNNKNYKVFDYETLKKYKKRKISEYQKNLLSKKNLDKYKEECVSLINKDIELRTLFDKIGINKDDEYLSYISNNFFNKPHFLFTLEILILEAVEEANTLKVFRNNKNVLPLKVIKENYYRDEIIKNLKIKIYENEYQNKFKNLMKSLDSFVGEMKIRELDIYNK